MVEIRINDGAEAPSQAVVNAANRAVTVTDAKGRAIGVRKLSPLDRLRLFEVVGPENAKNEPYLGYASIAFHVASIDGDPVNRPATKPQLEALIQRLDDEGIEAVSAAVAEHFIPAEAGVDAVKNG